MNIVSPTRITYDQLDQFLKLRATISKLEACEIHCSCQKLIHVDPLGLCVLKHWFAELEERDIIIWLDGLNPAIEAILAKMHLFDDIKSVRFVGRANAKIEMAKKPVLELRTLTDRTEVGPTAAQLASALAAGMPELAHDDPDGMQASPAETIAWHLEYIFSEILLNALTHGKRRNYIHAVTNIAVAYYPWIQKIELAVLDNGCGLLETLQTHPLMEDEFTHCKAISIAVKPRVSCNRDYYHGLDTGNQGVGLTVSTQMVLDANGRCGVFSGDCVNDMLPNWTEAKNIPFWQGTGVFFQFDRDPILSIDKSKIMMALPGYKDVSLINFG